MCLYNIIHNQVRVCLKQICGVNTLEQGEFFNLEVATSRGRSNVK